MPYFSLNYSYNGLHECEHYNNYLNKRRENDLVITNPELFVSVSRM